MIKILKEGCKKKAVVQRIGHQKDGIVFLEGKTIFVKNKNLQKGDKIILEIVQIGPRFGFAEMLKKLEVTNEGDK